MDLGGKAPHFWMSTTRPRRSLNPCFGGFGWERTEVRDIYGCGTFMVLILVLVDLGGKAMDVEHS